MKSPQSENSGKEERELKSLDDLDAEELVKLARRKYAKDFPNSDRRGCPPAGEILKTVNARGIPDHSLLAHLFECSVCFGEYRQALAQRQDGGGERNRLVSIFSMRRVAAAGLFVLLILGIRFGFQNLAPDAPDESPAQRTAPETRIGGGLETAQKQQVAPPSAGLTPQPSIQRMEGQRLEGTVSRSSKSTGPYTVIIDSDKYLALRQPRSAMARSGNDRPTSGENEKQLDARNEPRPEEKLIRLPAARAHLILYLPETAARGAYQVSLVDAFDKVLMSRQAFSNDGAQLRVTLNLSRITPEKYRLRISREGEAPAYYDVIIYKP